MVLIFLRKSLFIALLWIDFAQGITITPLTNGVCVCVCVWGGGGGGGGGWGVLVLHCLFICMSASPSIIIYQKLIITFVRGVGYLRSTAYWHFLFKIKISTDNSVYFYNKIF